MRSDSYTIGFAAVITIVCSLLLSIAYTALKPIQDVNVDNYVKSNILAVAKVEVKQGADIGKLFSENLKLQFVTTQGDFVKLNDVDSKKYKNFVKEFKNAGLDKNEVNLPLPESAKDLKLPLYTKLNSKGDVELYILPVHGMGLWSLLEGYIALEADLNTVSGITFYQQTETAGLGAEIQAAWFPANFPGKKIYNADGKLVSIKVKKGKVDSSKPNEVTHMVDGISGATITGDGVTTFLLKDLTLYEPAFKKIIEAQRLKSIVSDTLKTAQINSAEAVKNVN